MHDKTITELSQLLENKETSSQEITQSFLERMRIIDPHLNAFITINEDYALQAALDADKRRKDGNAQKLTGIPIAHKDIFCTRGVKTSCGSHMLDNFISPYDATVTKRCKDAGMVLLGKTNMDEFAMGSSNENSFYGYVHNPWNPELVPGGSSGGSAAAVAASLTPIATGTDTGGSIRQPAAFCGITGLKPTYGRVSRFGMVAFASSLDQGGPLSKTAADAALLMNVIAGFDPQDSTSVDTSVPDYTATLNDSLQGLRIGIPKEFFSDGLDPEIATAIQVAAKELEKLGASLHDISLPNTELSVPAYYIIAPAECSSNLARYDGVRYGYRCEEPKNLDDLYKRSRSEAFGDEVKRRIMIGTYALSAGYYDAYYLKAQKVRRLISQEYQNALQQVDVILGPTTPTTSFALGSKTDDPISMYLNDIYTIAVNLAGLPAISVPAGFAQKLPIGMQLIANHFQEAKLLNIAHQYQQVTDWHKRQPEMNHQG